MARRPADPEDVTELLQAWREGDERASAQLLETVYATLKRIALGQLRGERAGHTLQPTALVHEAWLRLVGENHLWHNRRHFFAAAAEAMRRILVDQARRRLRLKRGGAVEHVPVEALDIATETGPEDLLRVHDALERLAAQDPLKAELIKLRFFVGLRIPEAAEILGVSATTAKRHWTFARAWLQHELSTS